MVKTQGGRLAWARRRAGFKSADDAAKELEVPIPTYRSHEAAGLGQSRSRAFKEPTAKRYGAAFGVSWSWLLTGEGTAELSTRKATAVNTPDDALTDNRLGEAKERQQGSASAMLEYSLIVEVLSEYSTAQFRQLLRDVSTRQSEKAKRRVKTVP